MNKGSHPLPAYGNQHPIPCVMGVLAKRQLGSPATFLIHEPPFLFILKLQKYEKP